MYQLPDPHDESRSKTFTNAQGQQQGTCVHLGECDVGCKVKARNTLDLNYIPLAERHHAEVRPLHLVRNIVPVDGGYRVEFDRIANGALLPGSVEARIVVLAAGLLGLTELLFRCRDVHRSLPALSPFLGRNWSSNGDFLTPALHPLRTVNPTRDPTITAAIDLARSGCGRAVALHRRWRFSRPDDWVYPDVVADEGIDPHTQALIESLRVLMRLNAFERVMPWFAQSRDAADGRLSLKDGLLRLEWDVNRSVEYDRSRRPDAREVRPQHSRNPACANYLDAGAGSHHAASSWRREHGNDTAEWSCRITGEVFGYRNLYVADAAIVPEASA